MKATTVASMALAALASASPATLETRQSKTPPVSVRGNAFFKSDGSRFYIRGVDYQPGGAADPKDPLANPVNCRRDIKYFQQLGLNTVRIYTVDNSADHSECMQELADAGIYLALDVNSAKYSLNRADVAPSYNPTYLQNVFATIDKFVKYDNTLLFFSANEVINDGETTHTAPYIKALTRDMKAYMAARGYRRIPVGYSAADVDTNRYQTAQYMNCGNDDVRSDFFAFNDYSWCDPNTFDGAGWNKKVADYANYSIPLFLSEYGCNKNPPREFEEVKALYSTQMTGVYSGGLVYQYAEESDNPHYGLVQLVEGSSAEPTKLSDFNTLMTQLQASRPPSGDGGYRATGRASTCPSKSTDWDVDGNMLPAMPSGAQRFMREGAGAGVGLTGPGSQTAGGASTSMVNGGAGGQTTSNGGTGTSGTGGTSSGAATGLVIPQMTYTPLFCVLAMVASAIIGGATVF